MHYFEEGGNVGQGAYVEVTAAEAAAQHLSGVASGYGAAVERLRADLGAIQGNAESGFNGMADQFTRTLLEAADRTTAVYGSAATGLTGSVATLRDADAAALDIAGGATG